MNHTNDYYKKKSDYIVSYLKVRSTKNSYE